MVAIDLEWKPERGRGQHHKVAMVQLASSTVALLIRTSRLGFKLGTVLEQFLRYALLNKAIFFVAADIRTSTEE